MGKSPSALPYSPRRGPVGYSFSSFRQGCILRCANAEILPSRCDQC
jgi:hypothetical protein